MSVSFNHNGRYDAQNLKNRLYYMYCAQFYVGNIEIYS